MTDRSTVMRVWALAFALALGAPAADAQISNAEHAARRDSLAARIPDGAIVALGAPEPTEDFLSFWQAPDFLYLTGVREPEAALVMMRHGGRTVSTLFVQPLNPAAETWTGRRTGVAAAMQRWGIAARPASELETVVDSLARAGVTINIIGQMGDDDGPLTRDAQIAHAIGERIPSAKVADRSAEMQRLRGRKSPAELEAIRRAAAITVLAHREAAMAAEPGMNEFELEALIEYTFRRNGADRPSFSTIVGSGPNSTILHYNTNDRFINAGEVVVMDIGASFRGYSADVTRTIPISGKFTPDQRAIYQIVRDAQAAGERNVKIGGAYGTAADSAARVLAEGLTRLGLIESPTATYDCGEGTACPQLRLYYMHGLGHGIGLEVHDPDQMYWSPIGVGSAFSIEPGIYVRENVLETLPDTPRNRALIAKLRPAVTRYANIGVRIEDDYIVTEKGVEWISRAPRELAEVEALMAQPWTGPAKRDPAMVEYYRTVR